MRFHWLRCRTNQKQFIIYWKPGEDNNADYFTKHHAPKHHIKERVKYIHASNFLAIVKDALTHTFGCEGVLKPSYLPTKCDVLRPTLTDTNLCQLAHS